MFLGRSKYDDIRHRLEIGEEVSVEEQKLLLQQMDYERKNFPYFYVALTPKQAQIFEYTKNYKEVIVPGGNRCGKTLIDCMCAISRISNFYPVGYEARKTRWGDTVYKPLFRKMVLPNTREKARVWISCIDRPTQAVLGGLQETLMDLIPPSWIEDVHTLCGKYITKIIFKNGGIIEFKSAAVGRRGYQGAAIDFLIADEGHPKPVMDEALSRSGTHPLKFLYTYFPQPEPDVAWMHDEYIVKELDGRTPDFRKVTMAEYEQNVMIDKDQREDQVRRWKEAGIYEQRAKGIFADIAGRVYKTFKRSVHVMNAMDIPEFAANGGDPPEHWIKFMGVDTHNSKKGCAAIMCALDPKTGRRVYFNEYQDPNDPYSWCDYFNKAQEEYGFTAAYIDPSAYAVDASGFCIGEKLEEMTSIPFEKATRNHAQGRYAVQMGLAPLRYPNGQLVDGLPGIIICDHCTMTIRQMETYSFKADTTEVIKSDDEYCDCLRYVEVTFPQNWYGPGARQEERPDYGNPNLMAI